jgi:hypothetical protein
MARVRRSDHCTRLFVPVLTTIALLIAFKHVAYGARATLRIASPSTGGLIVLSSGAVLAWNHRADIQVRQPSGEWGPKVHLKADFVESATEGRNGALLLGELARPPGGILSTRIFSVDSAGDVTSLPLPLDITVNAVAFSGNRDWVSTQHGLFEITPDGRLGDRLDAEQFSIIVGVRNGPPVVCVERDLSMAHFTAPYCHSTGPNSWKATGDWIGYPLACGEFIVEIESAQLSIRSASDGRLLGRRSVGHRPAIACGTNSDLLVGENDIVDLSLPQMAVRWTSHQKLGPITALARTKDRIVVFSAHGSYDIEPPKKLLQ